MRYKAGSFEIKGRLRLRKKRWDLFWREINVGASFIMIRSESHKLTGLSFAKPTTITFPSSAPFMPHIYSEILSTPLQSYLQRRIIVDGTNDSFQTRGYYG